MDDFFSSTSSDRRIRLPLLPPTPFTAECGAGESEVKEKARGLVLAMSAPIVTLQIGFSSPPARGGYCFPRHIKCRSLWHRHTPVLQLKILFFHLYFLGSIYRSRLRNMDGIRKIPIWARVMGGNAAVRPSDGQHIGKLFCPCSLLIHDEF